MEGILIVSAIIILTILFVSPMLIWTSIIIIIEFYYNKKCQRTRRSRLHFFFDTVPERRRILLSTESTFTFSYGRVIGTSVVPLRVSLKRLEVVSYFFLSHENAFTEKRDIYCIIILRQFDFVLDDDDVHSTIYVDRWAVSKKCDAPCLPIIIISINIHPFQTFIHAIIEAGLSLYFVSAPGHSSSSPCNNHSL